MGAGIVATATTWIHRGLVELANTKILDGRELADDDELLDVGPGATAMITCVLLEALDLQHHLERFFWKLFMKARMVFVQAHFGQHTAIMYEQPFFS